MNWGHIASVIENPLYRQKFVFEIPNIFSGPKIKLRLIPLTKYLAHVQKKKIRIYCLKMSGPKLSVSHSLNFLRTFSANQIYNVNFVAKYTNEVVEELFHLPPLQLPFPKHKPAQKSFHLNSCDQAVLELLCALGVFRPDILNVHVNATDFLLNFDSRFKQFLNPGFSYSVMM